MEPGKALTAIFKKLDDRLTAIDKDLREDGALGLTRVRIEILGQMSLLANRKISALLSLAHTVDLDARMEDGSQARTELQKLLNEEGLVLDPDAGKIWIPPGSKFEELCSYSLVEAWRLDAESALVSKAVKAPEKNKELIQQAIASEAFPGLVKRILDNGGNLENFL